MPHVTIDRQNVKRKLRITMRRNLPKLLSKTNLKCKCNRDYRNKYSSKIVNLSSSRKLFDEQKVEGDIKDI